MSSSQALLLLFISFALAGDISLQAFSDPDCSGNSIINVHPNAANEHDSSGCVATPQYQSINIISADPGFHCNVYSDTACANFLDFFDSPLCKNIIGTGITCFSQETFDDPFAGLKAVVTLGKSNIVAETGGDTSKFVSDAVATACTSTGCDPNSKSTSSFKRNTDCNSNLIEGKTLCNSQHQCSQTVSVAGNFDNTNERDYMSSLLQTTMQKATGGEVDNPSEASLVTILSFSEVIINDQKGNNQAQMSISVSIQCENVSPSSADCDGLLGAITSAALEAVPAVGGFLAPAFEISCQALS